MATLVLSGNAGQLLRLAKSITAVAATATESKNISFTLDDADFSVTFTDGAYGSQKKAHK
jgi:hypothetical protein